MKKSISFCVAPLPHHFPTGFTNEKSENVTQRNFQTRTLKYRRRAGTLKSFLQTSVAHKRFKRNVD